MTIELLTAALVLITAFYAWATFKILRANEKVVAVMHDQVIATSRPYVVVAPVLELDNPIFYLRISNLGRTAATNLRLTIDKSFFKFAEESKDRDLASFSAFNQPIDSFPPRAEITFSLAQGFKIFEGNEENPKLPHTFSVTAEYEFADKQVREVNQIDLKPYLGADIPQDAYVRKLKDISESLKKNCHTCGESSLTRRSTGRCAIKPRSAGYLERWSARSACRVRLRPSRRAVPLNSPPLAVTFYVAGESIGAVSGGMVCLSYERCDRTFQSGR